MGDAYSGTRCVCVCVCVCVSVGLNTEISLTEIKKHPQTRPSGRPRKERMWGRERPV